jgi:EmrB/QacA subfamily drug resistance transporter
MRTPRWALAITSVAFFMVALDALVVTTALPAIGRDLHAGLATLQWTVNSYGLTYAVGIITAAALGDRFGRRRVFTAGLVVFTAASAACALAPGVSWLLAARAVQGFGAAAVMPLSLTILTSAFPAARRGAIVGVWGGLGGLAVAGGPLIGGAVTEGLDWQWIFWLNVPIGLVATALARTRLPESYGGRGPLDVPALVLLGAGALAVVWGLTRAGEIGWLAGETLAALVAGALLTAGFVAWERRAVAPMLPPRLFRVRDFAAANVTALLMIAALTGAVFLTAQYCQVVLGYSPLVTGLRLLPWTATPLVVAPLAGRLSDTVGRRPVLATGMLVQAGGLAWFGCAPDAFVPALLTAGIGVSMAIPTAAAAVLGAVAPQDAGKASGTNSTMQRLGAVLGVAVVTAVLSGGLAEGFRPALLTTAGLSLLGALTALALRRKPAPMPTSVPEPAHA